MVPEYWGRGRLMMQRAVATGLIVATLVMVAPDARAQAPAQLNDHVLPVAAGALVGAAATFFLLPLIVPATAAAAATAGASTTASPLLAVIGAGVGGVIGYEMVH
jgi:hypothetical protein